MDPDTDPDTDSDTDLETGHDPPADRGRRRRHRAPRTTHQVLGAAVAVVLVAGAAATAVQLSARRSEPSGQPQRAGQGPPLAAADRSQGRTSTPPSLLPTLGTGVATGPVTGPSATSSGRPQAPSTARRSPAPGGTRLTGVYVTAYSWFDNTPAGSSTVSHPVLHRRAGGTGTYADPVTVAVGHDRSTGRDVLDHPPGTRFYLPYLRRYVIVEDTCGDGPSPQDGPCHDLGRAPAGTTLWLDVWIGGEGGTPGAVEACAARLTGAGGRTAVLDPPPGLPVLAGPVYSTRCALP